jgi:glycosyltransferase involved in cell wall biosynthesis
MPSVSAGSKGTVLYIARSFPPTHSIASIRSWNMSRQLAAHGWNVDVMTLDPAIVRKTSDWHVQEEELNARGIRRIFTGCSLRMTQPSLFYLRKWESQRILAAATRLLMRSFDLEEGTGWVPHVIRAGKKLARRPDVIIATGSPFASFLAAWRLARHFRVPYVLDYRDPWSQRAYGGSHPRHWTRWLETRLLHHAAAAFSVSPAWAMALRLISGPTPVHMIPNAFDPDELDAVEPRALDGYSLVYAGRFYPPHRVVDPVLKAIKRAKEIDPEVGGRLIFNYFGTHEKLIQGIIDDLRIHENVRLHGQVNQTMAWQVEKGADLCIVITTVRDDADTMVKGTMTGKLYELLGLRAPILLISPDGCDVNRVVEGSQAGWRFAGNQVEQLARFLLERAASTEIFEPGDTRQHSWPAIGQKVDDIVTEIMSRSAQYYA